MDITPHGVIDQSSLERKDDYLYRLSIKGLIVNDGKVLVVKEALREWWDLPGGGMDHGETIKTAISRELQEEVAFEGDFGYHVVAVEDPMYLVNANVLQVRIIFKVVPETYPSKPGPEAREIKYIDPRELKDSTHENEKRVYEYYLKATS